MIAIAGEGYTLNEGGKKVFGQSENISRVPEGMVFGALPVAAEFNDDFWGKVDKLQGLDKNQS